MTDRISADPTAPGPWGDPIAYGPTGIRCGCGKDAHSNLVPCAPDVHAEGCDCWSCTYE